MNVTLAQIENLLIKRCGKLMAQAGLDATTKNGTNADLVDPIAWASRQCGGVSFSFAELSAPITLSVESIDKLLDFAEYRTLETITQNLDDVDLKVGPRDEKFSQLVAQVERAIERKLAWLKTHYGWGLGTLEGGSILLSFQQNLQASED